jgi:hypothetical protein
MLQGSKKSHMHMKVPSTTTFSFPALLPLFTAGKNKAGYILDKVVGYWWEIQKERDHWEDQDVGGWTILKWFLEG